MNSHSLRWRLVLLAAVSIAGTLGAAGLSITYIFERHIERRIDGELDVRLSELLGQITATAEAVSRIEEANTEISGAKAAINAVATTLSLAIEPAAMGRVSLDGVPLDAPTMSLAVVARTLVGVEGVGNIVVEPQIRDRAAILERLRLAENETIKFWSL